MPRGDLLILGHADRRRAPRTAPGMTKASAGLRKASATQAAENPTTAMSQPSTACQPAMNGTGGRSTSPCSLASFTSLVIEPTLPTPVGHHHERADGEDADGDDDQRAGQPALAVGHDRQADAEQAGDRAVDPGTDAREDAAGHHRGGDDREGHRDREADDGLLRLRFLRGRRRAGRCRLRRCPRPG